MSWVLTHRSSVMKMPYRFALQTNPTQVLYKDGSSPTILACDKLTSPFSIRREVTIPEDWRPGTRHAPVVATFLMIVRKYLTNSKGRLSSSFIHPYISVVPVHPAAEGVVARKQRDDGVRNHIAPPPPIHTPSDLLPPALKTVLHLETKHSMRETVGDISYSQPNSTQ